MTQSRKETNRYRVLDKQGNELEVIELTPSFGLTLHTNSSAAGARCSQLSMRDYELSDGTRVIKVSENEFQTPDGPNPRKFIMV